MVRLPVETHDLRVCNIDAQPVRLEYRCTIVRLYCKCFFINCNNSSG
jgi:hypothetical protein